MDDGVAPYVSLNGRLIRSRSARISVFDRGLQYGDGLFETVRVYEGVPFALAEHVERMCRSARFLKIPLGPIPWTRRIHQLLERNGLTEAWIRLVVTRGVAAPGLVPRTPADPTVLIMSGGLDRRIQGNQRRGVRVELVQSSTEGRLAHHKMLDYVAAMLAKQEAESRGGQEALYVGLRGRLSEGSTSNLFVISGKNLSTPPLEGILPGVTRAKILSLASSLGIRIRERRITAALLLGADEAFLSSSLAELTPIIRVGAQIVGSGSPGPITRTLQAAYREQVRTAVRTPASPFL